MDPVELPLPPSTNDLWRVTRYAAKSKARVTLSRRYREWLDFAIVRLRMDMPKAAAYPVAVRLTVLRGKGWRRRDGDNLLKPVVDALVKAERITADDDEHVTEFVVRFGPDAATACVLVTVKPLTLEGAGS